MPNAPKRRLAEAMAQLYQDAFAPPKKISFAEFSGQWLRDYAEGAVKLLTLRPYRTLLKVHLNPAFGGLMLAQICLTHVRKGDRRTILIY